MEHVCLSQRNGWILLAQQSDLDNQGLPCRECARGEKSTIFFTHGNVKTYPSDSMTDQAGEITSLISNPFHNHYIFFIREPLP